MTHTISSTDTASSAAEWTHEDLPALNRKFRQDGTEALLEWASQTFAGHISFASSFGAEDVVIIHHLARLTKIPKIFFLDTGRLHEETYVTVDRIRERYGVEVAVYTPDSHSVQAMVSKAGLHHFYTSLEARQECCRIRKLEPLNRALARSRVWITGLRQEQSVSRLGVELVEVDPARPRVIKVNPLAAWTTDDVWNFIRRHHIPYNALHDRGFPSIGCSPCTRAAKPGEDLRSGRWWWEAAVSRECGLHQKHSGSDDASKRRQAHD